MAAGTAVSAIDIHTRFTEWSKQQGVEIQGVKPAILPGRGVGLIADEDIKQGQRVVLVPNKAMFNAPLPARSIIPAHGELSTQARLTLAALQASQRAEPGIKVWEATWPTRDDMRAYMPLQWPTELQALLPATTWQHLKPQIEEFERDFVAVSKLDATIDRSDFLYFWCIVNSRGFHFKPPGSRPGFMVMCPFMDYLNHGPSGTGIHVSQTPRGYEAVADRDYAAGSEILATYGAHPNDKLLVHYGFLLSAPESGTTAATTSSHSDSHESSDDSISLDSVLLPALQPIEAKLCAADYWGQYTLRPSMREICFRTQVAMRALFQSDREWEFYRTRGEDPGGRDQSGVVRERLSVLLGPLVIEAEEMLALLEQMRGTAGDDAIAIELLVQRWGQVKRAVEEYIAER